MKKKNANNRRQLNRNTSNAKKTPQAKSINKTWLLIGVAALLVVVAFTAGLVWFYSDSVVARVNGINIRGQEVRLELNSLMQNDENFQMMMEWGMMSQEEANEIAAEQVAFAKLFEEYARQNAIRLTGNETPTQVSNTVINAIIADPSLFAYFEAYLPEDEVPEAEARASDIMGRIMFGEDFSDLMHMYSEDPGLASFPDGYAFVEGGMVEEFCVTTRSMEIGEISGPVRTDFGFHIIKRIEPPEEADIFTMFGQIPPPLDTDEEVFGVKHILISAEFLTLQQRQQRGIITAFEAKLRAADLVFLRGLSDIGF